MHILIWIYEYVRKEANVSVHQEEQQEKQAAEKKAIKRGESVDKANVSSPFLKMFSSGQTASLFRACLKKIQP